MGFDDLGFIAVPLLALLLYRFMPFPEDAEDTGQLERADALIEEAPQPQYAEVRASQAPAASSALVQIAPIVVFGLLGYIFVLLFRGIGLPHRS